ncbi:DUF4114 domain-containing protein [Desulfococcaceae bacterium HSG8]|nr:DUF4114 domain-containing protein [Desulfococcaceae bacterium HSG8]
MARNFSLSVVLVLSLALTATVWAQDDTQSDVTGGGTTEGDVQFTPGYIGGYISVSGERVQNAEVKIVRTPTTYEETTDTGGSYKVMVGTPDQGDNPWDYSVYCEVSTDDGRGKLYFKMQTVSIAYGETRTVNFNINPGYIGGKITVPGNTVSSGYIQARRSDGSDVAKNITVASDGTFSFPVQPDTNIMVWGNVTANGISHNLASQYVNVTAGSTSAVNWTIASATIRGQLSVGGTGIPNVRLTASGTSISGSATSDADGNYELTVFIPEDGEQQCTVTYTNFYTDNRKTIIYSANQIITISYGQTRTLDFSFSGRINGSIALPDGIEISSGTIYIKGSDGKTMLRSTAIASDGTFTLPVRPDSNMQIWGNITADGSNHNLSTKTLNISANQTQTAEWVLASAQVKGNVKVAGAGVQNARITVTGGLRTVNATTDANGNYDLTVFIPEDASRQCSVSCTNVPIGSGNDYLNFDPVALTLSYGNIKTINFNVTPGYIRGKVAVSDETVSGYLYAKYTSNNSTFARVAVASDGSFSLPVYPNTDMVIWGSVRAGGCTHSLSEKPVNVGINETKTVSWTISTAHIIGRVSAGNIGVSNALISVPSGGGFCSAQTRTAQDGTYSLTVFVPENSTRECSVSCSGTATSQPSKAVTLAANETKTVNWTIASGQIAGRVMLGSTGIANALISVSGGYSTKTDAEGNYSLTVNMSGESAQTYTVSCTNAYAGTAQIYFNSQSVIVSNGDIKLLNFYMEPIYIGGSVGYHVSRGTICARLPDGTRICASISADGTYTLPVPPLTDIIISGSFTSDAGLSFTIESQTMNISEDDSPEIDLSASTTQGMISGSVSLAGLESFGQTLDRHYVRSSAGSSNISENGGKYAFVRLSARTYYFYNGDSYYVDSFLNNGDDHFRHPPANFMAQVQLETGEQVVNDVTSDAALVKGKIILQGTAGIEEVSQGDIYAYGIDGTSTESGWSSDKINPGTGDYDLVVSEGDWDVYDIRLKFDGTTGAGESLDSSLDIKDYSRTASNSGAVSAVSGETVENDMTYETGTVIIRFAVPDGATLKNPRLEGDCETYNDGKKVEAEITASGSSAEVIEGKVAFIGIPGTYHLSAFADVISGGVVLEDRHFGDIEVTVIANREQEVNTNGPSITIETPAPGYTTCDDQIMVSGTITYNEEITSVLVNGETADFTSTGNPGDPNEVSFSVVSYLEHGVNNIEITAESSGGGKAAKTIKISRYAAGVFTVGDDGVVTIDWLYDGGMYEGEMGIFSLTGMDIYAPNSVNFIKEAVRRAMSNNEEGYVVISDKTEGSRFSGLLGEPEEWNSGPYLNAKEFHMIPGDTFATILVPNFTLQELYGDPGTSDVRKIPLFSLASANPEDDLYLGQIADINGKGNAFIYEDKNFISSDKDYNDLIFQVQGVIVCEGKAPTLDSLIAEGTMDSDNDWRVYTELGEDIMAHVDVEYSVRNISVTADTGADLFIYDPSDKECGKDGCHIAGAEFEAGANGSQTVSLLSVIPGDYRVVLHSKAENGSCGVEVTVAEGETEISSDSGDAPLDGYQVLRSVFTVSSDLEVTGFGEFEIPTDADGNPLYYDYTGDNIIDDRDVGKVSKRWNAEAGDADYDPFYDLDGDDYIGILDIMPVVNSKTGP